MQIFVHICNFVILLIFFVIKLVKLCFFAFLFLFLFSFFTMLMVNKDVVQHKSGNCVGKFLLIISGERSYCSRSCCRQKF